MITVVRLFISGCQLKTIVPNMRRIRFFIVDDRKQMYVYLVFYQMASYLKTLFRHFPNHTQKTWFRIENKYYFLENLFGFRTIKILTAF